MFFRWACVVGFLMASSVRADDAVSEALPALFEEVVLADNVFHVREHARSLSPEARYEFLRAWVLPAHTRGAVRLFAKLTPAEPVPPIQQDHPLRYVVQAEIYNQDPQRPGATYPAIATDQSPAGRLRTVRRGRALSYLYSTFDSDSFQVLHTEEVTDEPLHLNDIHLRLSAYRQRGTESQVSVVWKEFQVRADKITNLKIVPLPIKPTVLPPLNQVKPPRSGESVKPVD